MHLPLPILIPLCSALVYAFAAMMLKRATVNLHGPWRVTFVTNITLALFFAPFWLVGGQPFSIENALHAMICGASFFGGQIFTFLALSRGDVSVATPVFGSKVIFVALFAVLIGTEPLTGAMWLAAALTTVATALLGGGGGTQSRRAVIASVGFGFISASCFAMTDVLAQKWGPHWGFGHFAPTMFMTVGLLSIALIPFFRGSFRELDWHWLAPGSLLLALQASGIAFAIMAFGSATTINVVYNSRGVWAVVLVWVIGHWFGNFERTQGTAVMLRRLAGSTLLLGAIAIVARR